MIAATLLHGPAGLVLDLDRRIAVVGSVGVRLSRREFDLLAVLLADRGRVVPFAELADRVWGHEYHAALDQRYIYTTAWRLRSALTAAGAADILESVRGFGYVVAEEGPTLVGAPPERAVVVFDPDDPDLRILIVNRAAVEFTGYSVEVLTDLRSVDARLWAPEERAILNEAVQAAMATGQAPTHGRRLLRADGTTVLVDIELSRLETSDRPPLCLAEVTLSEPASEASSRS